MSFSCKDRNFPSPFNPVPVAILVNFDEGGSTIDTSGSEGDEVKITITRNGILIETSPETPNDGSTEVPYIETLQNGDIICVLASYDDFVNYAIVCKAIPTPQFGFVPIT